MTEDRRDPTDEVPEADLLEQRESASADGDEGEAVDSMAGAAEAEANEADRQEQLTPVGGEDEDYPHA
jgi:hypothetical protein